MYIFVVMTTIYVCLEWVSERVVMYSELGTYSGGFQRTPPRIDYSERTHTHIEHSARAGGSKATMYMYILYTK